MKVKKFLSIIIAVIMLFGIVPSAVFADEVKNEETDVFEIISEGVENSETYIREQLMSAHNSGGVTYGYEWYIIAMLRAGKTVDAEILDEYYSYVAEKVKTWDSEVKPTDAERIALALTVMGKNITDIDGVNLAELIYNNNRLSEGSNELAYALIALDAADVEIPEGAVWNRESIIDGILNFQTADGAFGLADNTEPDFDMTAICLQALAPYSDKENVKEATESALRYLKEITSDNVNSAAQTLLTAALFKIDVTNPENGFGDSENNLFTTIEQYRNPEGNGYMYDDRLSSIATFQVMQAYDAYKKAHKEDVLYWNFCSKDDGDDGNTGNENEDENEPDLPEVEPAEPATVYVTIASEGNIVKNKNDAYVAQAPVTVNDRDKNGTLTLDEALYATHEVYYDGGAETGYSTFTGAYGLSLEKLWGKGTPGESAVAGYWLNNASCWSLNDKVSEGDYITAFNYYDIKSWSDSYSYFDKNEVTAESGTTVTLNLNAMGYDDNWNMISKPYQNAKVKFLSSEISHDEMTTDENGQVEISLSNLSAGKYYVMAYDVDFAIVPAICRINVTENTTTTRPPSSGGGGRVTVKNDKIEETEEEEKKTEEIKEIIEEKPEETEKNVYSENTFSDVRKDDWYYESVKYVYENNLMQGTENGFEPESKMTRAMLVTVLYRMVDKKEIANNKDFKDVSSAEWYYDAIAWASANGIVSGISKTEFAPRREVTREQMAVILYRFAKFLGYDISDKKDISDYEDYEKISDWALEAVMWAKQMQIISGTSETTLSPQNASTRAQVATVLMRFCESNK